MRGILFLLSMALLGQERYAVDDRYVDEPSPMERYPDEERYGERDRYPDQPVEDNKVFYALRNESPAGLEDAYGSTKNFINVGPTYCWNSDNHLEKFLDDVERQGCRIPRGATGHGNISQCNYHTSDTVTVQNVYNNSINLWAPVGTPVYTTGQSSPQLFEDATTFVKIADDSATVAEGAFNFNSTATLSPGDSVSICVYAADPSSGNYIDVRLVEFPAGGACTGTDTDFTSAALTSDWKLYEWNYTAIDTNDCNFLNLYVYPLQDRTVVAQTGSAYVVASLYWEDHCPSTFTITGATAVTYGDDWLYYDGGVGFYDGSGEIQIETTVTLDYVPFGLVPIASDYIWDMSPASGSNNRVFMRWQQAGVDSIWMYSKLVVADNWFSTSSRSMTQGVTERWQLVFDFVADTYNLYELIPSKSNIATDSTARVSPTGMSRFNVGADYNGSFQYKTGVCINNLKVEQ